MSRPANNHYPALLAAAVLLSLIWLLSIADPCLIAYFRGGPPPAANPISMTECAVSESGMVLITRLDVVVRLASLALLMGLFRIVSALLESARRKRSFAGIAAVGANGAFAIYMIVQLVFLPGASFNAFHIAMWASCVSVASLAVMLGAAIAATTQPE